MKRLKIHELMALSGLRNRGTIYSQIRKGNLSGFLAHRTDGGLREWFFDQAEAERFTAWIKSTRRFDR